MRRILAFLALGALPIPALAGVIGTDDRQPIANYALQQHQDVAAVRREFGASGRIMCPFGAASAFLVDRPDIVVTARHVLYPEPQMGTYAGKMSIHRCGFELTDGTTSTWHAVDVTSFVYPPDRQRSTTDRFDWVVMRLQSPVEGVSPYHLTVRTPQVGDAATLVTIRQDDFPKDDWNERLVAACRIRAVETIDAKPDSGLKTDCSASSGASGGALLERGSDGWNVVGIMSSASPSCPHFDARSCYSYEIGMSDDVKRAIRTLSGSH